MSHRLEDLRRTCVHEYGHMHVARHHGVYAHVRIEPNPDGGDDQYHYGGDCHILTEFPSQQARIDIALAGGIAELIASDEYDPDLIISETAGMLSPIDRIHAGAFDWDDVERCHTLLQQLWPAVLVDVEREVAAWLT
jgi:hypothetical protein